MRADRGRDPTDRVNLIGTQKNPAFQNEMLDEYMKKYGLEDQDWRKQRPWYNPNER